MVKTGCRVKIVFFLFFLCTATLFSQSYSETYAQFFSSLGYNTSVQLLENSKSADFPHNVIVSFGKRGTHRLVFAVSQQGVQPLLPFLRELCSRLSQNPPAYQVDLVLTANDFSFLPPELTNPQPAGTLSAIEELKTVMDYSTASVAVVILSAAAENQPRVKITAGALGVVSPSWLLKRLGAAFEQAFIPYVVAENLPFLYHLGFQESKPVLDAYLGNYIPAVYCSLSPEIDAAVFLPFVESYTDGFPQEWDSHYFFFHINGKPVVISERLIVIILVLLIFVLLFFLFEFSFFSNQKKSIFVSVLKKNWFVIIFLILVTAASLFMAQLITKSVVTYWQTHTIQAFAIKMLFFCVFIALLTMVQQNFIPVESVFIHDYLLRGAGLLNILIFSAVDVSLFIFFAAEYLIILLLTLTRTRMGVITVLVLMCMPFLPFLSIIGSIQHSNIALAFVSSSFKSTAVLTLVLIPFELGVMRYLTLRRYYIKKPKKSVSLLFSGLIVISFLCISLLLISIGFAGIPETSENNFFENTTGSLKVAISQSTVYDLTNTALTISVPGTAVRFDIEISSQDGIPVVEASLPHTELTGSETSGENTILFMPDEYPPNPLKLSFSSWNTDKIAVTVRSFFMHPEDSKKMSAEQYLSKTGKYILSEEKTFYLEKKGKQ